MCADACVFLVGRNRKLPPGLSHLLLITSFSCPPFAYFKLLETVCSATPGGKQTTQTDYQPEILTLSLHLLRINKQLNSKIAHDIESG